MYKSIGVAAAVAVSMATLVAKDKTGPAVAVVPVTYSDGTTQCKGVLAVLEGTGQRPAVLVVHEWWGLDDHARRKAVELAQLGYVAFACDMYGDGKLAKHPDDAMKMYSEIRKNAGAWRARGKAGLKVLQDHARVDSTRLAVIGYCFGGSTALELAYSCPELAAAVSFHGGLSEPKPEDLTAVKAKILVCHGAQDSFIKEEICQKVRAAWDKAKVDYQFNYYGGALHSFTVAEAATANLPGIAYSAAADRRSWRDMLGLFDEVFKK